MGKPHQDIGDKILYWPMSLRFWEFGKKFAQGPMKNRLRNGPWAFWYRSGKKQMAGSYENGRKTGLWTRWWENGQKASEGEFVKGLMHGTWTDWFEDGKKAQQSQWDQGVPRGETIVFDHETSQVKSRKKHRPTGEKKQTYTLMTDRDMAYAVQKAQRARLAAAWGSLVGSRISRHIQPWQGALWLFLLVPALGLLEPEVGLFAVPIAATGASLVSVLVIILTHLHDGLTRADLGTLDQNL